MSRTTTPKNRRLSTALATLTLALSIGAPLAAQPAAATETVLISYGATWQHRVGPYDECLGFEGPGYAGSCTFTTASASFGNSDGFCGFPPAATYWGPASDLMIFRTVSVAGPTTLRFEFAASAEVVQIFVDGLLVHGDAHQNCQAYDTFDHAVQSGSHKIAARVRELDYRPGVPIIDTFFDMRVTADIGPCNDGVDNDGDGATDHPADAGCSSATDPDERLGTACDNGADDDGDGATDYPADAGCRSPTDPDERNGTACDNGVDDDGDGRADHPSDPGCAGPTDASEEPGCDETLPGVVVCIAPGREAASRPLQLIDVVDGPQHHVAGYLDSYRFKVPGGGTVVVPCVGLVQDGTTVNPCEDAGGTFSERVATLVEEMAAEPRPQLGATAATVRVCEADVRLTVLGFGVTSAPAYTVC